MSNFRGSIHSEIPRMQDIAELTTRLNDKIHASTESNIFITFFFGILDREKNEMSYVNAGHNPPLLLNGKGEIQSLGSTGFCLGMFPSPTATYEMKNVSMGPGDLLCIFTDGFVESRDQSLEEYGDERLGALLKESTASPSKEVVNRIYDAVFSFTGCDEASDDMTIIVVKR